MRIIFKISKYILLSAAAVSVAVAVFVETGYFKGLLKNELASRLGPLTGGTFTFEELSGTVFTGVALKGVRLDGAGGRFFQAERIDASYSLPALLAGRVHFTDVAIDRPIFTIGRDSAGRWSYEGLFPPSKKGAAGSKGISVVLRKVRISEGRVSLKHFDKPATLEITGVYLSASARIRGDTADMSINELSAKGSRPLLAIKSVSGKVRFKGSDLNINELKIRTEYSSINIDGTITNMARPIFNIDIDCHEASMKDISALMPGVRPAGGSAGGVCSSAIRVTGNLDELKVVQSLEYISLKMHNEAVVRPGAHGISVNSRIRSLKPCDIMPVFTGYKREACPSGELSMDIQARAQGVNLNDLRSSISVIIHPSAFAGFSVGESTLTAAINGRLVSLEGEIELSRERFNLSVLGAAGENAFRLDKLRIKSPHFVLVSKGVLGYGSDGPLDMVYSIGADDLGLVSIYLPAIKIAGMVSSTGTLKGTMGLPCISAELDGRDISFSGFSAGSVKAKIALERLKLLPDVTADVLISGLQAGRMTFDRISILARNRHKSARIKISVEKNQTMRFMADAGVTEKGNGNFSVDINKMSVSANGLLLDNIPATLDYFEKILGFKARIKKDGKTIFTAEGTVPVDLSPGAVKRRISRKGLKVSIKSNGLGLDILPLFTDQVKSSSGLIRADILIEGDPLSPRIRGKIDIAGGSLTLLATAAEYRDINASIALNGKAVILRHLTMKSGGGSAELAGKIMLKGFIPTDAELDLKCRNFNVMSTSLFTGNIDSDLKIKGLYASGTVTVIHGAVNIPSQARAVISDIEFVQTGPGSGVIVSSAAEANAFYELLRMDIRVLIPGKTWVYGASVSADIKGELNLTKKRYGPMSYAGEIDIVRGSYKINERMLAITEGKVLPGGGDFTASLISAKASCKIGDVFIDVIMGGTIRKPIITFQSDPPMERSDIISYLAFGAPSGKLSQPQSSALKSTSFDILAGFAGKDIKGVVERVVPIDELTLKPSENSWDVGKYITDKLFAKYEWRSGQDERPQTVLDYRLDRHFSLNSQFGNPKTTGVDLFWKLGY